MEGHPESSTSSKNQLFELPQLVAQAWTPIHNGARIESFEGFNQGDITSSLPQASFAAATNDKALLTRSSSRF
jgi:hypothetical protein